MKKSQLVLTVLMILVLLAAAYFTRYLNVNFGAVPWYGWAVLALIMIMVGLAGLVLSASRDRQHLKSATIEAEKAAAERLEASKSADLNVNVAALDPGGPAYPHPVINSATCIGCHACVDACPHDVLAIVNGISTPIALDQCMEDTGCQVECPTSPKSCVVVNTKKKIPERKVPKRDNRFMTNVPGIYLIGDVSGVPLIKNAINEGGSVIDFIAEDLKTKGANGQAEYDVAIVGVGPGGLSATALAKQKGMRYVAIEQDKVVATIQAYPAGKYVFFKPDTVETAGGIELPGIGLPKETMIGSWLDTIKNNNLKINEYETCKSVKNENGIFVVRTDSEKTKQSAEYRTHSVIIAVGGRGTPMRLKVAGEEIKLQVTPSAPVMSAFCVKCGLPREGNATACPSCKAAYPSRVPPPYEDEKVKYRLSDPNLFSGKHCIVVGAGNSAIEAAVDLAAYRSEDGTQIIGWRDNTVTLVIRSDFKGDLKLGNKMLCYECMDEGKITTLFRKTIKEITPTEVALMSARERDPATAKESDRIRNDYIFALIGGDKPTKFLESMGIQIG
ncbi:MAG: NAD(P)-binding domain-containing protein [Vicinamibacterales bacterium]